MAIVQDPRYQCRSRGDSNRIEAGRGKDVGIDEQDVGHHQEGGDTPLGTSVPTDDPRSEILK